MGETANATEHVVARRAPAVLFEVSLATAAYLAYFLVRGLTETSPDPEDGRRLLVSLTRAGQQMAEKAAPNALAITRETLAPLDAKERETLLALLSKLR